MQMDLQTPNNPKPTTNETKPSNTMAERTVYLVHDAVHLRRSVELAPHRRQWLATQLLDHLLQLLDVEAALSVTTGLLSTAARKTSGAGQGAR